MDRKFPYKTNDLVWKDALRVNHYRQITDPYDVGQQLTFWLKHHQSAKHWLATHPKGKIR